MPRTHKTYAEWRLEKLSNPERAARYLNAAKRESKEAFLYAVKNVVQANQVARIAREAGISRESVYRSFSAEGNPTLDTLFPVLEALEIDIEFVAAAHIAAGGAQSGGTTTKVPKDEPQSVPAPVPTAKTYGFHIGNEIAAFSKSRQTLGSQIVTGVLPFTIVVPDKAQRSFNLIDHLEQGNEEPWHYTTTLQPNPGPNLNSPEQMISPNATPIMCKWSQPYGI